MICNRDLIAKQNKKQQEVKPKRIIKTKGYDMIREIVEEGENKINVNEAINKPNIKNNNDINLNLKSLNKLKNNKIILSNK